jgi:hypothetical protein
MRTRLQVADARVFPVESSTRSITHSPPELVVERHSFRIVVGSKLMGVQYRPGYSNFANYLYVEGKG